MAVSLKHTAVAVGVEAGNGEIGKDEWNDEHVLSLATGKLVGRTTAGDGAAEEISVDSTLTLAAGSLGLSSATLGAYVEVAGDTMTGSLTMGSGANVALTNTTNANQFGVITKGGTRWAHDFNYGNNGTVTTIGQNTFAGLGAGNLTMGSTAVIQEEGSSNTGIGSNALAQLTTGYRNACVGHNSGSVISTGHTNTLIGHLAGAGITTGTYNTAVGGLAGATLTTAAAAVVYGYRAGAGLTSGSSNSLVGNAAGAALSTGSNNVAVGSYALDGSATSIRNVAIGDSCARTTTTGSYNAFVGYQAGYSNRTGSSHVAIGYKAGVNFQKAVTAGSFVTGISYTILSPGTTDFTAIGAANSNAGTAFTATGAGSGTGTAYPTSCNNNTSIGYEALLDGVEGQNNTALGYGAGKGIVSGSGNLILGYNLTGLSATLENNILLGSGGTVRQQFDGADWWFSGSIGYATGQGGAVTQATSRTTGVTLNKNCGAITLVSAAGSTSWQSFTVTNSEVAATDTIIVNQKSGTDKNMIHVTAVGAGSFEITFATTGGTTTEQPVFNFSVLKAVAA